MELSTKKRIWKREDTRPLWQRKKTLFDYVNIVLMILMMLIMIYPYWYSLVGALNEGRDYNRGGVFFWPRRLSYANFYAVFRDPKILRIFGVTFAKAILGTASALLVTSLAAFAISRRNLRFRKIYIPFLFVTMYISGGLIPYFILINKIGLYDRFLVYIIPGLFNIWNMIILQSSFKQLPESLIESARIDGAGPWRILFRIVLPLSKPVLAALTLFGVVGHWNSYFDALMFTNSPQLQTIQLFLKRIITDPGASNQMAQEMAAKIPNLAARATPQTIKLAAMIVTSLPILMIYPFLQKYFAKGITIGSVKG